MKLKIKIWKFPKEDWENKHFSEFVQSQDYWSKITVEKFSLKIAVASSLFLKDVTCNPLSVSIQHYRLHTLHLLGYQISPTGRTRIEVMSIFFLDKRTFLVLLCVHISMKIIRTLVCIVWVVFRTRKWQDCNILKRPRMIQYCKDT